jgi:hypothetical protein
MLTKEKEKEKEKKKEKEKEKEKEKKVMSSIVVSSPKVLRLSSHYVERLDESWAIHHNHRGLDIRSHARLPAGKFTVLFFRYQSYLGNFNPNYLGWLMELLA